MTSRELDALVAQARGWNINWSDPDFREGRIHWCDNESSTNYLTEQYQPSTDIAEAMALVEEWDGGWKIEGVGGYYGATLWRGTELYASHGDSLTAAICLAYLKVKGVEVWARARRWRSG